MNLTYNSFFVNKYLRITNPYNAPRNICELGRRFALVTFLYTVLLGLASFMLYLEGYIGYKLLVLAFTDAAFSDFMVKGTAFGELFPIFMIMNFIYFVVLVIWGANHFGERIRNWNRHRKYLKSLKVDPNAPAPQPHEPSQAVLLVKGWYEDFKAKTCTIVEYKGLEEAKEARNKAWHWSR